MLYTLRKTQPKYCHIRYWGYHYVLLINAFIDVYCDKIIRNLEITFLLQQSLRPSTFSNIAAR